MHNMNCADVATRQLMGELAPHGNPSYLRWALDPKAPTPTRWHQNMPPELVRCPVCRENKVLAASHATLPGVLTLTAQCGHNVAAIRAEYEQVAPRAFYPADDDSVPLPAHAISALVARAATGQFTQLDDSKVVMKVLGDLHAAMGAGTCTRVLSAGGHTHLLVFRFETEATASQRRRKEFRQVHALRAIDGRYSYELGLPTGLLPLVGLDQLAARPNAPVVVSEGEKARAAGAELLPDYVHVSSVGGSDAAHKTDWSALHGRQVYVVPDNDPAADGKLSPGQKYALRVAARALKAGAREVRVASWPTGTSPKHDLADGLPAGMDSAAAGLWLANSPVAEWDAVRGHLGGAVANAGLPALRQPDGWLAWASDLYAETETALSHLPPKGWQWRYQVLCGLHHAFGGSCLPLYEGWLRHHGKAHKQRPGEAERVLQALDREPMAEPLQVVTLLRKAAAAAKAGGRSDWQPDEDSWVLAHVAAMASTTRKLLHEGKVVIASQRRLERGQYELRVVSEKTAESMFKTERVRVSTGTVKVQEKMAPVYPMWETSQWARPLTTVFHPSGEARADEFNMFHGLDIRPDPGAGTYARFKALLDRAGRENNDAGWLWNAIAYRVQNQSHRMNNVLCLMGPQGSGKSTISQVIGMLCAPYNEVVTEPENLVGNFNSCVAGKLVVSAEDMTLSRKPEWEEKLRSYATSARITVTNKGNDSRAVDNFMWVILTSNNMALTVRKGERRFAMYRMLDPMAHDPAARDAGFMALMDELRNGGFQALLADLLAHEIPADFMPGVVPRTPLYHELVDNSTMGDPMLRWWLELVERGYVGEHRPMVAKWVAAKKDGDPAQGWAGWREPVRKSALYEMYKLWVAEDGTRARNSILSKEAFSKALLKLLPASAAEVMWRLKIKEVSDLQEQYFVAPSHADCVRHLEHELHVVVDPEAAPVEPGRHPGSPNDQVS